MDRRVATSGLLPASATTANKAVSWIAADSEWDTTSLVSLCSLESSAIEMCLNAFNSILFTLDGFALVTGSHPIVGSGIHYRVDAELNRPN